MSRYIYIDIAIFERFVQAVFIENMFGLQRITLASGLGLK